MSPLKIVVFENAKEGEPIIIPDSDIYAQDESKRHVAVVPLPGFNNTNLVAEAGFARQTGSSGEQRGYLVTLKCTVDALGFEKEIRSGKPGKRGKPSGIYAEVKSPTYHRPDGGSVRFVATAYQENTRKTR